MLWPLTEMKDCCGSSVGVKYPASPTTASSGPQGRALRLYFPESLFPCASGTGPTHPAEQDPKGERGSWTLTPEGQLHKDGHTPQSDMRAKVSCSPSLELKVGEVGRAALPVRSPSLQRPGAGSVKRRLNLLLSGC